MLYSGFHSAKVDLKYFLLPVASDLGLYTKRDMKSAIYVQDNLKMIPLSLMVLSQHLVEAEARQLNVPSNAPMAKDRFHQVVRTALEREGWQITADPYEINIDDVDFEIDLAAEQLLAAEREHQKIAVEVKSFLSPSNISDFHIALGQFLNYRDALEKVEPERQLYLAVRVSIYQSFFQRRFIRAAVERYRLRLVTYDVQQEVIVQWL